MYDIKLSATRSLTLSSLLVAFLLSACSKTESDDGTVTGLNCSSSTSSGSIYASSPVSDVNAIVTYVGGNGGSYSAITANSTGVTGLTATVPAGTFSQGNGGLTVTISGTASNAGTASFALSIGGQTCTITRTVIPACLPHTCGAINVHNSSKTYGTITDIDGNQYKTIQIGSKIWMAENLKTTRYRNGNAIPNVTSNTQWSGLTTGAYCSHENNPANDCPQGKLYNWYAITDSRGLAPAGWHVATDAEWTALINSLGGDNVAGGKMRSIGTQYWRYFSANPDGIISNETGLSLLPTYFRNSFDGAFPYFSQQVANYPSATDAGGNDIWARIIGISPITSISRTLRSKRDGMAVRCVKD